MGLAVDRAAHRLAVLPQPLGPGVIDARGRIGRDFAPERQNEGAHVFDALAAHIAVRRRKGDVVVASYSVGARERLAGLLADSGVVSRPDLLAELSGGGDAHAVEMAVTRLRAALGAPVVETVVKRGYRLAV